jgi:hypothetical protein
VAVPPVGPTAPSVGAGRAARGGWLHAAHGAGRAARRGRPRAARGGCPRHWISPPQQWISPRGVGKGSGGRVAAGGGVRCWVGRVG